MAKINDLEILDADIVNEYTHRYKKDKIYTIVGNEFGEELEGRILNIAIYLYGLKNIMAI